MSSVSVVIGIQNAHENLPAIFDALRYDSVDDLEILVCAPRDHDIGSDLINGDVAQLVEGPIDALIPELWRDGIMAASHRKVAILTAHCIPTKDWLPSVQALEFKNCAAFGGAIELGASANAVSAAIHMLRYASATPPLLARSVNDVAADNAVYDRNEILECADLLESGFWEPSYHERFRKKNLKLEMRPEILCQHENRYTAVQFMKQRRRHGRVFGRTRATNMSGIKTAAMLCLTPLIFLVHGAKLSVSIFRNQSLRGNLFRASPWLMVFLANWTWGEACGYADHLFGRRPARANPSKAAMTK